MSGENAFKVMTRTCPNCGAQIPFDASDNYVCEYCNTHLMLVVPQTAPQTESHDSPSQSTPAPEKQQRPELKYDQFTDATEGAFSMLVPQGWHTKGGVERARSGIFGQKKPAKIDFTVMNDEQASIAIRWLPDMVYMDMQASSTGMIVGAMYPPGSKYSGFTISPALSAHEFLMKMVFPVVHSQAQQINILRKQSLPMIAQGYQQRMTVANPAGAYTYDAGLVVTTYDENGVRFKEAIFTVIENQGFAGDGKWGSKETLLVRAPENAYDTWLPTFSKIQQSAEFDPQWVMDEVKSQSNIAMALMNNAQVQMFVQSIIQNHQATKMAVNQVLFQ